MSDRRNEIRMMCADMVETRWKDGRGKFRRSMALLEDISASGACLQFEEPVPVGAEIAWENFRGRVSYCVYREIGHFAGVEFNADTLWSENDYQPHHLLDPRRIRPFRVAETDPS
jgi:hypothetical protein